MAGLESRKLQQRRIRNLVLRHYACSSVLSGVDAGMKPADTARH